MDDPKWWTRSLDLTIGPTTKAERRRYAGTLDHNTLSVEVWKDRTDMAKSHGMFGGSSGRVSVNRHGVRGILHMESTPDAGSDWYFAVPFPKTGCTVDVRLSGLHGDRKRQAHLAKALLNGLVFK